MKRRSMEKEKKVGYVIANFGGPRSLEEIYPFLKELLTDQDVIRTLFPKWLHSFFFSWVAKRRVSKVRHEYASMGGKSPIYWDTEEVVQRVKEKLNGPVLAFHRYLPATHEEFIYKIHHMDFEEIIVFPMFPQFTYATSGSLARWFQSYLSTSVVEKMRWIKSYADHSAFVASYQEVIKEFLVANRIEEENTILIFSAHGIPQKFVDTGDLYPNECLASFLGVMQAFPNILGRLSYQSKFGRGEWIKPYTIDVCNHILSWNEGRTEIVFVPIAFTSDHIETLCEIEREYMTVVRQKGCQAYRVPALNLHPRWIQGIAQIIQDIKPCSNKELIFNA